MASVRKTVGEVELEILDLPADLKTRIRDLFNLGEKTVGRPNVLQIVQRQGGDPYKFVLEIVYRNTVLGESLESICEFAAKKYKVEIVKSALFNVIKRLSDAGILSQIEEIAKSKVKRKVRVYWTDEAGELHSDIEYVEKWIQRQKHVKKRRVIEGHLRNLEQIINMTGKLPEQWTEEDITNVLNVLYEKYKKGILELAAKNHKGFYSKLSEKELDDRARENTRRYLTTIRVFLKWIGRSDLCEKFGHTEWKREYTITDYISLEEFNLLMRTDLLTPLEKFVLKLHVTLGCREGHHGRYGLAGLQWSKINWEVGTIDVYESKTKGGVIWQGCYLNLFFPNFVQEVRWWYENGRVCDSDFILESLTGLKGQAITKFYARLTKKVSKILDRHYRLHFNRKTHAVWLIEADVPLELIAGKPSQAFFGVGWEDVAVLLQHYGAFTRQKIQRELEKVKNVITPRLMV